MKKRVAIFGAGAIGLDLATHLIRAGNDVTIIARDQTADALESRGIVHRQNSEQSIPADHFTVVRNAVDAGSQDLIWLSVKVDSLLDIAPQVRPLLNEQSIVVSATNGIPPWYSYLQDQTLGRYTFPVEYRESFLSHIPGARLIGAIVERSCELAGPGELQKTAGKGFTLGEPNHEISERCQNLRNQLSDAGYTVTISDDIHRDIWLKLIGNVAVNPMSVITQLTIGQMLKNRDHRDIMIRAALEAQQVGERMGIANVSRQYAEEMLSRYETILSDHKTSMLQDYLRGKPLEIRRMLHVIEMLAKVEGPLPPVPTPTIEYLIDKVERAITVDPRKAIVLEP